MADLLAGGGANVGRARARCQTRMRAAGWRAGGISELAGLLTSNLVRRPAGRSPARQPANQCATNQHAARESVCRNGAAAADEGSRREGGAKSGEGRSLSGASPPPAHLGCTGGKGPEENLSCFRNVSGLLDGAAAAFARLFFLGGGG